jgi:hypothetical protein
VVLFADAVVETVDKLVTLHNGAPVENGTQVAGGLLRFASGGAVQLDTETQTTLAQSFRSNDGALFHVVKVDKGAVGWLAGLAADTDILVLASDPALVFLRNGSGAVELLPGQGQVQVSALTGEALVDGNVVDRGPIDAEGVSVAGELDLSPGGDQDFMFALERPDGTTITRDDLLASGRELEYDGPVTKLRFRGRNLAGQNLLMVNEQPYPLEGGLVYTITATDMTVHLYNDNRGKKGRAMGHWRVDRISATDAEITYSDDGTTVDGNSEAEEAAGNLGFLDTQDVVHGRAWRTLSRGSAVQAGRWVKVEAFH